MNMTKTMNTRLASLDCSAKMVAAHVLVTAECFVADALRGAVGEHDVNVWKVRDGDGGFV